jgi:RimJ/RimL family protein N-acetyltransferase
MPLPARIVPIDEVHIESFHAAFDNVAREHRYLAFLEAPPLASVRDFVLANIRAGNPQLVALVDERVVGWCDVLPKDRPTRRHGGVLGIGLIEPFRKQGIGAALMTSTIEAAWRKGFTRIELTVRTDNTRATRLYEKLGFAVEGRLRKDMLVDGEYVDTLLMALVR